MRSLILSLLAFALLGGAVFADVRPLPESLTPLALQKLVERNSWQGVFDEYPNVRINSDNSGRVQNEEQACISPTDSNNFVAVWRDFRLNYRRVGVGYTTNAGQTWTDALFPQMFHQWQSDPLVVVDQNGVYTANLITFEPSQNSQNALLQVTSTDGGVTWHDSVFAADSTVPIGFEDKQMLNVDTSPTSPYRGSFYCTWTHFYGPGPWDSTHIWLDYKRPGQPYSAPVVLSQTSSNQWPNVCTGPNGEVYASWCSYANGGIAFCRSTNGGQTFTPQQIATHTNFVAAELAPHNTNPSFTIFAYGAMGVDTSNGPHRGRLYMVFTDSDVSQTRTDIYLMYSDNNGTTWSARQRINDDNTTYPVDHFHPWISVDEAGRVWIAFYDRRLDPNNIFMDVYFAVSTDGGATWRANERLTTVSSNPGAGSVLDGGLIGEYIGWQARRGKALCVWTDTRLGNQDVFSAYIDSTQFPEGATSDPILHSSSFTLSSYPNPTNGASNLIYTLDAPQKVHIRLYNLLGQIAKDIDLGTVASGTHTYSLDLNHFASGLYFAELKSEKHHTFTKVMLLK